MMRMWAHVADINSLKYSPKNLFDIRESVKQLWNIDHIMRILPGSRNRKRTRGAHEPKMLGFCVCMCVCLLAMCSYFDLFYLFMCCLQTFQCGFFFAFFLIRFVIVWISNRCVYRQTRKEWWLKRHFDYFPQANLFLSVFIVCKKPNNGK